MALEFEVADLSGVDEALHSQYKEQEGGGFRLDVSGIDPADELKDALRKEREERKSAKEKLDALSKEKTDAEQARLKDKEEWKTLYEKEQEEKASLADELNGIKSANQQQSVKAAANKAVSGLTKDTSRLELLAEKAEQFTKYGEDGATYEIGGIAVSAEKVQAHLAEKYPFLVDGSGASGLDVNGNKRSGASVETLNDQFKEMGFN